MGRKGGSKGTGKKKGGRTISTLKRNNLRRQKLVKAGKLKPKSTPRFVEGGHLKGKTVKKPVLKPEEVAEKERIRKEEAKQWENEAYAELGEMMDPEDLEYLKKIYKNKLEDKKSKKNKVEADGDGDEDEYESGVLERHNRIKEEEDNRKSVKTLLPIRTKDGKWVARSREVEASNGDDAEADEANEDDVSDLSNDSGSESDEEKSTKPISVVDIVAKRRTLLAEAKIQIGTMASNFLELPEERLNILLRLCRMMGGAKDKESGVDVSVQFTVAKLAAATLLEIYKDTLPNYKIGDHEEADKTVKLKKDTLRLHKFETGLMNSVKNYLVKLSKATREAAAVKDLTNPVYSLGKYCLQCLCQLFLAHPNFNFTNHVVQFLVPYLNSGKFEFRAIVSQTLEDVFRSDKRGDVSFAIVKQINHFLKTKKTKHKIHEEVLMPLLSLKLYHLNDNQLTENKDAMQLSSLVINRKNAKGLSKKNKHIAEPILSKREKKRQRERAKLDKQLLEARGEESTQARLRFATDITNILFAIYFRVLKTITSGYAAGSMSSGLKLLHPVLNGLAKFGHLMSIEYFQDVLANFKVLLEGSGLPIHNYEKLLCLKTVFAILSGQGDNLTLDPAKFYTILNQTLIQLDLNDDQLHTTVKEKEYFSKGRQTTLALAVLRDALIVRRKKVARSTVAPTLKTVSISMLSHSSMSAVEYVKFLRESLFVAHPQLAPMLFLEGEAEEDGSIVQASSGVNLPMSGESDPFGICNGQSLMWEASLMLEHVSPAVYDAASNLLATANSKPRKRRCPLTIPAKAKLESIDQTEADEYFDILSKSLPDTPVLNGRNKKRKN